MVIIMNHRTLKEKWVIILNYIMLLVKEIS
jgi:hypothetical protein